MATFNQFFLCTCWLSIMKSFQSLWSPRVKLQVDNDFANCLRALVLNSKRKLCNFAEFPSFTKLMKTTARFEKVEFGICHVLIPLAYLSMQNGGDFGKPFDGRNCG